MKTTVGKTLTEAYDLVNIPHDISFEILDQNQRTIKVTGMNKTGKIETKLVHPRDHESFRQVLIDFGAEDARPLAIT